MSGRRGFIAFAAWSLWVTAYAAVPTQPALVSVSGKQLMVRERLADGSLDVARPYVMHGVNWQPATFAPASGPNPLGPTTLPAVAYGCFYDYAGRNPEGDVVMNYWTQSEFVAHYQTDIPLMQQMHVNTVRTFSTLGPQTQTILDAFYAAHIKVIVTVATSSNDYAGATPAYLQTVNALKNHPAILMWSLGNEWNINSYYQSYATMNDAIAGTQAAATAIHSVDPSHPVTSSLGDIFSVVTGNPVVCLNGTPGSDIPTIVAGVPAVDVWSLNIYRGASFGSLFTQWTSVTAKPFFIGEFGTDSYHTTTYTLPYSTSTACGDGRASVTAGYDDQQTQSTWDLGLWHEIQPQLSALVSGASCIGGNIYSFNDEPWEVGNYNVGLGGLGNQLCNGYDPSGFLATNTYPDNIVNEEYHGIVNATRQPKVAYYTLQSLYQTLGPAHVASIQAFDPPSLPTGGSSVVVTLRGSGFAPDAYVLWNGVAEPTTVINSSEVQWTVSAVDRAQSGQATVFVINPSATDASSDEASYPIQSLGSASLARVSPNPWRADVHRGAPITFDQLPLGSTVKIYTLSGRWVRTLDASNGFVDWDLKNDSGDRIASGLYLYLVTGSAPTVHGKFAVIQ